MASRRTLTDWLGVAVFASLSATTFGLGTWQVQRYWWKQELVAERKEVVNMPGTPLKDSTLQPYHKVQCVGTFDTSKTMLVGPRSKPKAASDGGMGQSGYLAITPFKDEDSGKEILVNRGWVKRADEALAFKPEPGVVTFDGVLAENETAGTFTPDHESGSRHFFAMSALDLGPAAGLPQDVPVVERIDGGGPLVTKTPDDLLNFKVSPIVHVGYAITWYGLCSTGLYMIRKRFFR
mmetsp:Transcript_23880/g.44327  ORF Transcript_23880/g.44327 Transcript_23880/m.44327 type:complete len:236 (-) Transcript_23880:8-715(-)